MTESQNNIWNTFTFNLPTNSKKQKFSIKNVTIKQIEKEKTITQGPYSLNDTEPKKNRAHKKLFINKKRGRRQKESDQIVVQGGHDKFSDDNIKRKVKTHFHNYIIGLLNSKFIIRPGCDRILKFGKIKSSITQNITVEFNQKLFTKKIKDIIIEVSDKYQNQEMNAECINYALEHQEENNELLFYLNKDYEDLYLNYYLKSTKKDFKGAEVDESFEAHIEKLKKYGEKYIENYKNNAFKLINFYKACKKRKPRKSKAQNLIDSSFFQIPSWDKKKFANFQNENNYNKNFIDENDYLYLSSNKISVSTQTDRKFTDDESESDDY